MPRTPLLRSITQMSAAVGAAQREGVAPIDAWSRRRFLQVAGAGAAAIALAGCLKRGGSPPPAASGKKVLVVGAGLAGLTAAYRLKNAGVDVALYEGSPRAGGRTWTRREEWADGQVSERGGERIDSGHAHIRALAEELGLRVTDQQQAEAPGTQPIFFVNGARYAIEDALSDLHAFYPQLADDYQAADASYQKSSDRGRELDQMSVRDYVDQFVPSERLRALLLEAYTSEYGADPSEQSALALVWLLGSAASDAKPQIYGVADARSTIAGGVDQIGALLAQALGDRLVLARPVTAIERIGGDRVRLTVGNDRVEADRVVLAIPFSTLRRVEIAQAGFRELKLRAIRELGYGDSTKMSLQFSTRAWTDAGSNGETFTDAGYQTSWEATRGQAGARGILTFYAGGSGSAAMQQGSLADAAKRILDEIEPIVPGLRGAFGGTAARDAWPATSGGAGSISFYRVGQVSTFSGIEAEPEGSVHFAGEHTSIDAQGTMEGAVVSGERAAREVLAALGLKP